MRIHNRFLYLVPAFQRKLARAALTLKTSPDGRKPGPRPT